MKKLFKGETVAGICPKHGFYQGDHCSGCGEKKMYDGTQFMFFTPWTYEDMDVEPVRVESRREMVRECRKRGIDPKRVPRLM